VTPDPEAKVPNIGYIGRIPVRNVWLLMLYASHLYQALPPARRVAVEKNPDELPNLVAEILTRAVERRLRRNLSFGFQRQAADLRRVRGHIDVLRTERHQLLQRGRVACRFEDLTVDTPNNRYVRAALIELTKLVNDDGLTSRCRTMAAMLERAGVNGAPSIPNLGEPGETFIRQPGRMNAEDRQMMAAAQLAFHLALPTEEAGWRQLSAPDREEQWARKLFEKAVGGFYHVVLSPRRWKVSAGSTIHWPYERHTDGIRSILPAMRTDIVLEHPTGRIIIDTKFTSIVKGGWHRERTLNSGYIYQIYAYLRSQERDYDPLSLHSTGILLHPAVEDGVDEAVVIQGHEIRFATVNLAADSGAIRNELLRLASASPLATRVRLGPSASI
jgi:5-methylcytosine-specific restriction enzyme subunit McrC